MSVDVLLDSEGNVPAPAGWRVIETEVDFLRYATADTPLLIRGARLCAWAEDFYRLRERPYRREESLSAALRLTFSDLSQEQAQILAQRLGQESVARQDLSAVSVLSRCYPHDVHLWQITPSHDNAARWLVWLCTHQPDAAETVVLRAFSAAMAKQSGNETEAQIYCVVDQHQARQWLYRWLGLADDGKPIDLGGFPITLPVDLLTDVKREWKRRLIGTQGRYFEQMLDFPLPMPLRRELAEQALQYYKQHATALNQDIVWRLQPYLSSEALKELGRILPPPEPRPLPNDEAAVLEWFSREYMPYRLWQTQYGDDQAGEQLTQCAHSFIRWYLERYPQWLLQPQWVSFQCAAQLQETIGSTVTLCIILDGLPAWDAEDFAGQMAASIDRLQLQHRSYRFAPLPTVTEFAKDALLKGMPPRLAAQSPPLGTVVPDTDSPMEKLRKARPGDLIFWRVAQPDEAYHRERESKREREVRAELAVILEEIRAVTTDLPSTTALQVIITSDHGRLLNARSPRSIPVPPGMQAHGRVAWGKLHQQFIECGFVVDPNAGIILVQGDRFEMAYDMAIVLGEESFQNIKSGNEPYPHGGLYPEEVIVPWFVFERDAQLPELAISIHGTGEAENVGQLTVAIENTSQVALECLAVSLSHRPEARVQGHWGIAPFDVTRFTVTLQPWPTKAQRSSVTATLLLRQPNGATFAFDVEPEIQSTSLYERDDSLLKELEL